MALSDKESLANVEDSIRACLVMQKGAVSMEQLNKDYKNFEDEDIPFKKFNFNTLLEFLSSLTHVLRIVKRNGDIFIRVIETEKTQHISSMVREQKPAKKSKRQCKRRHNNENNRARQHHSVNNSKMSLRNYAITKTSSSSSNDNQSDIRRNEKLKQDNNNYRQESAKSDELYQGSRQMSPASANHLNDSNLTRDDNSREITAIISPRIIERLRELIKNHPQGIWCAELAQKYMDTFYTTLNYADLGFQSTFEFASCLPDVFHCVREYKFGDFKLYNAKNSPPASEEIEREVTMNLNQQDSINNNTGTRAIPRKLESRTVKNLIPDNVMRVKESVGQIMVKDLCQDNEHVVVQVCELFSPSYFFVHLRQGKKIFDELMNELHTFYEEEKLKYQIAPVLLKAGLNVACLFNNVWHRAIIKSVTPEGQVRVHFYDYGTIKTYDRSGMCFLHKKFAYLPAQAILCGLYNVKPVEKKDWDRSVCHELMQKTKRPLIAMISSINEEENSALITLTDTYSKEDLHLNDWLIDENYAVIGRFRVKKNRNFVFTNYVECLEHKGYDSKQLLKNTKEPLFNDSFKYNDSGASDKTNKSYKRNSHQERNVAKIPSLLSLNITKPKNLEFLQKLKNSNTEKSSIEKNDSKGKIASHKTLKKTFALYSKIQEKKEAEDILSPLTSSLETSGSSEYVDTTESPNTNSPVSSKSESRMEMLLRYVKQSCLSVELNPKKSESQSAFPVQNLMQEKTVDISCVTKETNSSDQVATPAEDLQSPPEISDSDSYSEHTPLHFKEESQPQKVDDFGTLRSEFGGHGRMEPIDWNVIRTCIKKKEIDKSVCQVRSNLIDEDKKEWDKLQLKHDNLNKSGETNAKDVPKLLNIASKNLKKFAPIQVESSRFNNVVSSNFSNKEFLFTSSTHIKSSNSPISPLIKWKQRLHSNSLTAASILVPLKVIEIVTGGPKESEKINETVNDSQEITKETESCGKSRNEKPDNKNDETKKESAKIQLSEIKPIKENGFHKKEDEERKTLEPTGEEGVLKLVDFKLDQETRINSCKTTQVLIQDKPLTTTSKIEVLKSSETLDSDDYTDELSDPGFSSDSTITPKSIDGDAQRKSQNAQKKELIFEKKPVQVQSDMKVFNDMDITSDSESWDGMSFSGEIAPVKLKRAQSISSRAPSPARPTIDLNESFDSDILNFKYNDCMSRKKQEESSKKAIQSEALERNLSNSSKSSTSSITKSDHKSYNPPGRSQSLMRMYMNMKQAPKHI